MDSEDNFRDKLSFHSDLNDADCSKLLDMEDGGASFWVACIRECFEEVGVLLARKKDGSKIDLNNKDKDRFVDYRERLISNKISFLEICEREDLFFETTNIVPFSHWITPDIETKRFDTRFFASKESCIKSLCFNIWSYPMRERNNIGCFKKKVFSFTNLQKRNLVRN